MISILSLEYVCIKSENLESGLYLLTKLNEKTPQNIIERLYNEELMEIVNQKISQKILEKLHNEELRERIILVLLKRYLESGTYVEWCTIEMQHLLHKPYVNEVTLNGQKLYINSCYTSELKLCILRRLRSFQRGTVSLCRPTGFKVTSCLHQKIDRFHG